MGENTLTVNFDWVPHGTVTADDPTIRFEPAPRAPGLYRIDLDAGRRVDPLLLNNKTHRLLVEAAAIILAERDGFTLENLARQWGQWSTASGEERSTFYGLPAGSSGD